MILLVRAAQCGNNLLCCANDVCCALCRDEQCYQRIVIVRLQVVLNDARSCCHISWSQPFLRTPTSRTCPGTHDDRPTSASAWIGESCVPGSAPGPSVWAGAGASTSLVSTLAQQPMCRLCYDEYPVCSAAMTTAACRHCSNRVIKRNKSRYSLHARCDISVSMDVHARGL